MSTKTTSHEVTKEQREEIAHLVRLYQSACGCKRRADSDNAQRRSLANRLYSAHQEGLITKAQLVRLTEASQSIDYTEDHDTKFRDWLNATVAKAFNLPKTRSAKM